MDLARRVTLSATLCLACACGSGDGEEPDRGLGASTPEEPGAEPVDGEPSGPGAPGGVCGTESGFPGDEFCLPPPEPSEGVQLWVGPADYDDPEAVAPYLLAAGREDVVCFNAAPVQGGFYYLRQSNRMRSGSHHMLINLKSAEGRASGPVLDDGDCQGFAGVVGTVPGSQMPVVDFAMDGFGAEDAGLARWYPEGVIPTFQMHYVNTGSEPVMREGWINLYYKDEADVEVRLNSVFLVGDISVNIPPGTRQTTPLTFVPTLEEPTRIFELTGHSHAHNERFTAWRNRGTPDEVLLYESYDWAEPDVLRYNTVVENAPPDPVALRDGGHSGLLFIEPGDTLDFECEVNNTSDQALRFANEAYTAEMCLLAGSYVGNTGGLFVAGCASGVCAFGAR
jgi:hypothetical protein